jgi:uncharacterized protein (TIGR02246 family)
MTVPNIKATSPTHLMELFAQRAAAGDLQALMELYEPGAVFEPQPGVVLVGTDQVRAALSELVLLRPKIEYVDQAEILTVDDVALVSNRWTMSATAPDGSTVRDEGWSADVVRRQADGSWLVMIDQPRGGSAPS